MAEVSRSLPAVLAATLLAAAIGCAGDEPADACADLETALAGASSGTTVRLGACRVEGAFTVPAGVTLAGAGPEATVVGGTVVLSAGAALEDLAVETERGTGVTVASGSARIAGVTLTGPITEANASDVPSSPDPASTATHGIVVDSAGSAAAPVVLDDVRVRGFASFGLLAVDSVVEWSTGSASDNLGVGIGVDGGSIELVGLEVCRTLSGLRTVPAYGVVLTGSVEATTSVVTVCDTQGVGVLSHDARAVHSDFTGAGNSEPALWAQRGGRLEINGSGTLLSDNGVAGVVLAGTAEALVRDARIDGTRLTSILVEDLGNIDVGDAIQVVLDGPTTGVRIENVTLTDNARAGLVFDLPDGATVADSTVGALTVTASGDSLGAVAQTDSGPIPGGTWDARVTRAGATATNDAAFTGALDVVGIIGPMYLPPTR